MQNIQELIDSERRHYINYLFNSNEINYSAHQYLLTLYDHYVNLLEERKKLEDIDEITYLHKINSINDNLAMTTETLNRFGILNIDYNYLVANGKIKNKKRTL